MSENNVAAPNGEAAPLTNNEPQTNDSGVESTNTSETPALTVEQVAQFLGTTPETFAEYQKYLENNGGFDKAYTNTKKILSQRNQSQPQSQPQPQPQPNAMEVGNNAVNVPYQPLQQPAQQPEPLKGGLTFEELTVQNYFEKLADKEEYGGIKDEILNGEVLKQLKEWNIPVVVGNQVNTEGINRYLGMYAKTKPAPQVQTPVTTTPLADPIQISGDTIKNMDEAMAVLKQDQEFRAKGQAGHPLAKQANEFFDNVLNANQNRGKREHKVIESK